VRSPLSSITQCIHISYFSFQSLAKKDDGSYELIVPCFSPTAKQATTWVKADLGPSALALFKNYTKPGISGQTFHAVTAQIDYTEFAGLLEKGTMTFLLQRAREELSIPP